MAASSNARKYAASDFEVSEMLGQGSYGCVMKGRLRENKNFVIALKVVKKEETQEKELKLLKREIEIHSNLKHKNIVRLYGFFHEKMKLYIMLEYCSGGNAFFIMRSTGVFGNIPAATLIYQLSHALDYIHGNKVYHRDIKPENVLFSSTGQVKLCDFGCTVHHKGGSRKTQVGTLDYLAPEILRGDNHDEKVDIWGIGIMLFELLTCTTPFYHANSQMTTQLIMRCNLKFPEEFDEKAKQLILRMCRLKSDERIGAKDIIESEFIDNYAEKTLDKSDQLIPLIKIWRQNKRIKMAQLKQAK